MEGNQQQAAGQPPAGEGNNLGGNNQQQQQQTPPAGNDQQQQQPPQGNAPVIMTQEQFNRRWAEEKGNLEKELGLQPGGLKDFIATQKKPKPITPTGETLSGADLKIAKMEALMLKGIPSEKIPLLLQHIPGKTREDIDVGIQQLLDLAKILAGTGQQQQQTGGNQQQQQQQGQNQNQNQGVAQGAGQNGVPGNGGGPKIWTKSEVLALQKNNPAEYDKHRMEILQQMSQGLIK